MKDIIKKFMMKVPNMIRNFLMEDVNKKIDKLDKKIDINTRDDIRGEMVNFAEDLRQGINKSIVQYKHIFEIYDKYHSAGWNSYVTNEFIFIKDKYNEKFNK